MHFLFVNPSCHTSEGATFSRPSILPYIRRCRSIEDSSPCSKFFLASSTVSPCAARSISSPCANQNLPSGTINTRRSQMPTPCSLPAGSDACTAMASTFVAFALTSFFCAIVILPFQSGSVLGRTGLLNCILHFRFWHHRDHLSELPKPAERTCRRV